MDQILSFFISNAYAADSAQATQGGNYTLLIFFAFFFVIMYFTMIRPQSKRAKEQQNLMSSLAKGDEVVTAGGLLGKITKVSEQYVNLALTTNIEIVVQKNSVVGLLPKGTLKSLE